MKQLLTLLVIAGYFKVYSQQSIFVSKDSKLYTLDLNNCESHFIGSDGLYDGDIAFTPDRQLWGIVNNGNLYKIDKSSGNSVFIGNTGFRARSLEGLNDSTLLVEFDKKLYGIRTKDATSYYIDSIGYSASGDLTWYDNALYITTTASRLIKIVLNNSNSAILSVSEIKNLIPSFWAVSNVDFLDSFYSLVGFTGSAAYKICHIDGTYIQICPNIGGFDGAATIRLPIQKPEPTFCQLTTKIDKLNSKKSRIKIYPNPNNSEFTIELHTKIGEPVHVDVYDCLGQQIFFTNEKADDSAFIKNISLINNPTGIYYIKVITLSETYNERLLISK